MLAVAIFSNASVTPMSKKERNGHYQVLWFEMFGLTDLAHEP